MSDVVKFKAFCFERYKYRHDMSGKDTIRLFKQYGVMDYLTSFYDVLHTYGNKYIVQDIDHAVLLPTNNVNDDAISRLICYGRQMMVICRPVFIYFHYMLPRIPYRKSNLSFLV